MADYTAAQSDLSGITTTSGQQTTTTLTEQRRRSPLSGRRGLVLTVIVALAVLLLGVSLEAGMLDSGAPPAVNSPSDPMTGQQLYQAFTANISQASASYANKTVYIQDSVDFGVGIDPAGQYFSTVNSGSVVLVWNDQAQVAGLSSGETVLARCSVAGPEQGPGGGYQIYLQDCDLISTLSQTTSSVSISVANL